MFMSVDALSTPLLVKNRLGSFGLCESVVGSAGCAAREGKPLMTRQRLFSTSPVKAVQPQVTPYHEEGPLILPHSVKSAINQVSIKVETPHMP